MSADINGVLEMAKTRVENSLLDENINATVFISSSSNSLFIELSSGRNFELSEKEVKHQALEFINELY